MTDPHYVAYPVCVSMAGGVPIQIPTFEKNNFELMPDEVRKYLTPKTKAILLSFPANQAGVIMPRELLEELAEIRGQE